MMKTLPSLVRPLPAVLISLLWPLMPGVHSVSAQEKPAAAPQAELIDTDKDGLPDKWEMDNFRDLEKGAGDDPDADTLGNLLEFEIGTNPLLADSNGDGQPDWAGIPGYLYQEKWPEPDGPNPRDYYPRHLFDAPGAATFFHPGAAVYGKNEKFFRQRLRGRLIAPVSGEYEFFISGNNWCELWLGTDAGRFGTRRLAGIGTHSRASVGRSEFAKFPDQKSVPVKLVAGQEYHIEILHRTRSDAAYHVSVAWKPPGADKCVVIPQSALRSWVPEQADSADDGIGDAWKRQHGLAAGRNVAMEDPDGDGIVNGKVRALDGDPLAATAIPGSLSWSRWFNPKGITTASLDLAKFRKTTAADRAPDFRCASSLAGMRLPSGTGGVVPTLDRLQGTISVPETGLYSFWIMGKAAAELSLSTDAQSFLKRPLIRRTRNKVDEGLFLNGCDAVRSVPVFLEKGRPCFIEAIYTPEFGPQRLHVQWKRHEERSWSQSELSGGVSGKWTDRDGAMIASVQGPLSFGGAGGDRILFRHSPADGISEAICRIDALDSLAKDAGGGLMFRSSLDPFAPFVAVTLGADRRFGFHGRAAENAAEQSNYTRPYSGVRFRLEDSVWLRLRSQGGTCTASYSINGVRWTAIGSMKATLGEKIVAGPVAWGPYGKESAEVVVSHMVLGGLQPDGEIPVSALSTAGIDPLDRDGDGLPDAWERGQSLDPSIAHGADGPQGDPDGDGFTNLDEYRLGGNPHEPGGFAGYLTRELWRVKGSVVSDLTNDPSFKGEPHLRDLVSQPDLQGGDGDQHYGQRLRGTIIAPVSGTYRFWLAGDNGCSLSLSTDAGRYNLREVASLSGTGGQSTGVHEWERFPSQRSAPIQLVAGKGYHIEILHKEGAGGDHVSVAWDYQTEGGRIQPREILPSSVLKSLAPDKTDADDDQLPDEWEIRFGLSPRDNGFHDPIREGADGDFDKDRLTNREEFLLGTNPAVSDTDGDGVSDFDELRVYGSNPLVKDAVPPKLQNDFVLDKVISPAGTWLVNSDGVMTSTAMRGAATFRFTVDEPGLHVVRLDARVIGKNGYAPPIPVSALVDGVEIGRGFVTSVEGGLTWVTRWLSAGTHDLTIQNRNTKFNVSLEITSLKLFRMVGSDGTGDGLPDWYAKIIGPANAFALTGGEAVEMTVSPACIEGNARTPGSVDLDVDGKPCEVMQGIGKGWYANVPLAEKNRTVVSGRFEGGAITKQLNLVWVAVNPFQSDDQFKVRVGDAMKFTVPAGEQSDFSLSLDGNQIFTGKSGTEVTVKFERSGDHVLEASRSGTKNRRITITAMKADFGPTFSIAAEVSRKWKLPNVSPQLTLESDPQLQLDNITALAPAGLRATALWKESSAAEPIVLARLSEGGPILAATRLNVFKLVDAAVSGDAHVVDILPDGTRVVEISYIIEGHIPEDFSMWIDFAVTDAVFADGSTRYHLTAADFDESGVARIKIYKAPGTGVAFVCHWNRLFENETEETE